MENLIPNETEWGLLIELTNKNYLVKKTLSQNSELFANYSKV